MKTFNEFINEDSHFLRSIGKNDAVIDDAIPVKDLKVGDWFWWCSTITQHAEHCQIIKFGTAFHDNDIKMYYRIFSHVTWEYDYMIDEYTSMHDDKWIVTTDEKAFLTFMEENGLNYEIKEYPAK